MVVEGLAALALRVRLGARLRSRCLGAILHQHITPHLNTCDYATFVLRLGVEVRCDRNCPLRCDQEIGYPKLYSFGFRNSSPVCVVTYKEPEPHFHF